MLRWLLPLWFPSTSRLRLQNTASFALKQQFTPVFPNLTYLNGVYQAVGHTELRNAKRALIQNFKESVDFLPVHNKEQGEAENTGRSEGVRFVSEII